MERLGRVEVFRLLLLCWLVFGPVLAQLRHPLPVLWMMPISTGSWRENLTAAVIPAVRMALQDLQKQPAPLGNYEIQLQLLDSQCDPAKSLKALFDAMWAGPKYLLLFGGVCPPVTALIARALPALGLVQVSFAAMPPSQSNRKWYGNLFSTMPSDRALNQAAVKLLQNYKWTRVGVVTQQGPRHSEMREDLMRQLLKADVRVVSAQSLSDDTCGSLRKLKEGDVQIIIAQLEGDLALEVFCCAHTLDLFGAQYQWIVVGGAARWRPGWGLSGCTANHLLTAADGSIRVQIRQLSSTNTAGISGQTPEDYQDSYLTHLIHEGSEVSPLHSFAYDAVWVAAKALTQAMEAVKHGEKHRVQRNVTITEEEVQRRLLGALRSTRFEGVTGPVFFRNGERMTSVELIQIQGPSSVLVGEFSTSTQQLRLMNHRVKFKGRRPATDQVLVRLQHRHVGLFLYIMVSSAAAVVIFVTLPILCLSILSRRQWLLRSSCRSQDELLLLGIVLSSSSVLISGLDVASVSDWMFEMFCSVRLWTLFMGHTLIFSSLFVKTWRMHSLVGIDQKLQGRCPLLWLLLLDAFVLSAWQILDPLRRVVVHHSTESDSADPVVMIQPYSEHCSSSNMDLWLTAVCGYKGPLLGLGCFLAWNVRCAQVTKHLTLSMFAVTGFTVAGALGSLLAPPSRPVQFCLSGVVILCCSIFILSWTYGPSIFSCCYGDSEQQQPSPPPSEPQSDGDQLSSFNLQLRSRTAQLDVDIETITMQLSETSEPEMPHTTRTKGEITSVTSTDDLIRAQDQNSKLENINSPERVQRRLSVQLPILHHSYLPVVGGVTSSSSSPFGSHEAFDVLMTAVPSGLAERTQPRY